jgi:hypothetical protein
MVFFLARSALKGVKIPDVFWDWLPFKTGANAGDLNEQGLCKNWLGIRLGAFPNIVRN